MPIKTNLELLLCLFCSSTDIQYLDMCRAESVKNIKVTSCRAGEQFLPILLRRWFPPQIPRAVAEAKATRPRGSPGLAASISISGLMMSRTYADRAKKLRLICDLRFAIRLMVRGEHFVLYYSMRRGLFERGGSGLGHEGGSIDGPVSFLSGNSTVRSPAHQAPFLANRANAGPRSSSFLFKLVLSF